MPLIVLSRRSIVYRESGSGETSVLLVPGQDQIQIVKDLAGLGKAEMPVRDPNAAKQAATRRQEQLSRVYIGRRFIYGSLPVEISDLRQPVKVWLAEDYAPAQCQAFFFIFDSNVVIHGVREQDDEGQQNWRTAQLSLGEADPVKSIIDAISDYALANSTDTLTVAVQNKLDLYEKLQQGLATYNISPIPFSKLKPAPNLKPLYRHRDYTIFYLTLALFGLITVMASGAYMATTWMERNDLDAQVEAIRRQINSIKLNQNVGQVSDPQALLRAMSRGINQQPSAILHAAAQAGAELGTLENVKVSFSGGDDGGVSMDAPAEGQVAATVQLSKMQDELLVDQEQKAAELVATHPWVRLVVRGGSVGEQGQIGLLLQVDQSAETEAQPIVQAEPQDESKQQVGEGVPVSGTLAGGISSSAVLSETLPADAVPQALPAENADTGGGGTVAEQSSVSETAQVPEVMPQPEPAVEEGQP